MSKHIVSERVYTGGQYVTKTYEIELTIDVPALVKELGLKAARNRTGKSQSMKGAIKAKRLREIKGA